MAETLKGPRHLNLENTLGLCLFCIKMHKAMGGDDGLVAMSRVITFLEALASRIVNNKKSFLECPIGT